MKFRDHWVNASVTALENISPSIKLFQITPKNGRASWTPGSNIRIRVRVEDRSEIRTYSLIDTGVEDEHYRIAVRLIEDGQGGSRYMWSLNENDLIEISQPHNHFELSRYSTSYTLVAGGVGITPLVSMAKALSNSDKPVRLIYGVRTRSEAAFGDLLKTWLGERLELSVGDEDGPLDIASIVNSVDKNGELYVCGPIGMLEAISKLWRKSERPLGLLRYETFAASGHYPSQEFMVEIPRLNKLVRVPAHQSMLAALQEAGVELMSDCKRGECGLCVVDVVSTTEPVDHRDVFLSAHQKAENRKLCACVSRSAGGTVTIDTAYRGL
ncbi:PDR/VanB family oxidoreductase [Herminiimonas contaminans]|uniref:Oxidoreductase n=1 Tax=Herminiimonas contaminans TaxID=1111140 RepID=A0ABS0ETN0_9BURK|nr:PDR/VanB family oxidoreductase [Herminiimonas contaminans]MBF8178208.1 oxidoreductase [Herminiimonas contaminans]